MNEKANYGNWVPEKALYMLFGEVIGHCNHSRRIMHFDSGNGNLYADLS